MTPTDTTELTANNEPTANQFGETAFRFHGRSLRGIDFHPQSPSFEGRFGRMFRTLPPATFNEEDLRKLAAAMIAAPDESASEDEADAEENQGIDAGYTYLGQFIDHDLTFDPASSLQKQNDPEALVNFRSPRFDLDSMYGRGPDDQPYLYEKDGLHLVLGRDLRGSLSDSHAVDLPRNTPKQEPRRALIGDPRNDENVIISQLHSIMLRFHNRVVDFLIARSGGQKPEFAEVQKHVRWHYQWVVLHDFLPTIVGPQMINSILPHLTSGDIYKDPPKLSFYHWRVSPFIPIEFSVAAYRFGHAMIRPDYRLNTTMTSPLKILSNDLLSSLTGFRAFPANWAVDWRLYFNMTDNPPLTGIRRLQKSYKIDTSLVDPLGSLPDLIARDFPSLALRNLLRGWQMSLPSGQTVARQMQETVIPDADLRIGKATAKDSPTNPAITSISENFAGNAPLWFYILAEAQQAFDGNDATPIRLGPVGGRIVAEVIIGLLLGDQYSFLSQEPSWKPFNEFMNNGNFKMADLIKVAIGTNQF